MSNINNDLETKGDELMKQIGFLEEQTADLEDAGSGCDIEPEEVASWITVIGRALLAIFKP